MQQQHAKMHSDVGTTCQTNIRSILETCQTNIYSSLLPLYILDSGIIKFLTQIFTYIAPQSFSLIIGAIWNLQTEENNYIFFKIYNTTTSMVIEV